MEIIDREPRRPASAEESRSQTMPHDIIVLRTFSNEIEASMAQQALEDSGVKAFVMKDDAGGMEPHLQRSGGVRLLINEADAGQATEILQTLTAD